MEPETVFSSSFAPDPASARDVLAFVLAPAEAFTSGEGADELEAVIELLDTAKAEAVRRWHDLRHGTLAN
jgi:hypothetical protein